MPPSSARRTRTRRQIEPVDRSDADDVESITTPSRKRRKVTTAAATPPSANAARVENPVDSSARRKKPVQTNHDIKVFDDEPSLTEDDIDTAIRSLRKAKYDVQARVDYANEVHEAQHPEGKQAYAKIAGNGWTFYVDELEVRIGRPPDERQSDGQENQALDSVVGDKSLVHIDLGPSKHVSRQHAEIRYNENAGNWYVSVNGRNGIKLDETPLNRGDSAVLHSGCVIDVAGTQMMFVTPNELPYLDAKILAQFDAQKGDLDDEYDDDGDRLQGASRSVQTPTRGQGHRMMANHQSSISKESGPHVNGTQSRSLTIDGSAATLEEKTSPMFHRGLMLETTDDIDYAVDAARDIKPPYSYAQLIGMAILSSEEEKLTLANIYDWIKERYAFYRHSNTGWQNSIRHNLSLNKCFEKIARRTDEPGKGMKWQIVPEHRNEFIKKGLSQPRRARDSSVPNSPVPKAGHDNSFYGKGKGDNAKMQNPFVKTSPGSTPPMGYPMRKHAFTPDRGADKYSRGHELSSPQNGLGIGMSPFPYSTRVKNRFGGLTEAAATATPGGPTMLNHSDPHDNLMTPLITRHAPKLAPPSAAHLPSQFMPLSSPAPFWKYADFGSTPARPVGELNLGLDMSPEKMGKPLIKKQDSDEEEIKDHEDGDEEMKQSSPAVAEELGHGSPTRSVKVDRAKSNDEERKIMHGSTSPQKKQGASSYNTSSMQQQQQQQQMAAPPRPGVLQSATEDDDDDEEEGMIDLARGFQPIGTFHRNMNAGIIRGS